MLGEKIRIETILSSQANKEDEDDEYNDVDILIQNSKDEYVIIEIQNTKQYDYFHRILFDASKVITEYIDSGEAYENVKKVISITIAYFDLGQGKDYVYHGTTEFKGIHHGDILNLSHKQKSLYKKSTVHEIYPEYWIIKAGLFNKEQVNDKLDEWIYFLKTGEVQEDFTAAGLPEAKVKLDKLKLSPEERRAYEEYVERMRKLASTQLTKMEDVKDLLIKEKDRMYIKAILGFHDNGVATDIIVASLGISEEKVRDVIQNREVYERKLEVFE